MRREQDYYLCKICGRTHIRPGTPTWKRRERGTMWQTGLFIMLMYVGIPLLLIVYMVASLL
jgi:hypothetical protein